MSRHLVQCIGQCLQSAPANVGYPYTLALRKPSVDGIITSLEAYDHNGELIMQMFGARKPGQPERAQWTALAESAQ